MTLLVGNGSTVGPVTASISSSSASIGWNYPIVAVQAGLATNIQVYLYNKSGTATHCQFGIYSGASTNAGGGTLIAQTASTLISGLTNGAFNSIPLIANVNIATDGTKYTVGIQGDGSINLYTADGTNAAAVASSGQTYGTVPSTLPAGSNVFGGAVSLYVDGTLPPPLNPQIGQSFYINP